MNTLPPTIGFGQQGGAGSMRPSVSTHAQNFGVSRLNQQKERDKASVSMGRVIREKQYGIASGPSTSIDHILRGETTSQHDEYGVYSDEQQEEIRTRLRYQHIRQLMKEKKAAEVEEAKKTLAREQHGVHIKTGGTYSSSGREGAHKMLKKEFKKGKYTKYRNLSASDKKHLEEIVKEGSIHGSIGGGHSYSTKKAMGAASWKKYKQGDISKEDYKDFKRIIRDMD